MYNCFLCKENLDKLKFLHCKMHKFFVCFSCQEEFYVLQRLKHKTSNHYTFENYFIEALKKEDNNNEFENENETTLMI